MRSMRLNNKAFFLALFNFFAVNVASAQNITPPGGSANITLPLSLPNGGTGCPGVGGTPSSTTFLAGDCNYRTPAGSGTGAPAGPTNSVQLNNLGAFAGSANTTASQTGLQSLEGRTMYYASNWGVLANGKKLTDITTTASSATVCSGSYNFVNATPTPSSPTGDLAKGVQISAGPTTAFTNSTTQTGTNATIVTVSSTAGLTLENGQGAEVIDSQGNIPTDTQIEAVLNSTQIRITNPATGASTTDTITIVQQVTNLTISSVAANCAVLSGTVPTGMTANAVIKFATIDTGNSTTGWTGVFNAAQADPTGGVVIMPLGMSMSGPLTVAANVVGFNNMSMYGLGGGKSVLKWFSTSDQTVPFIGGNTGGGCTPQLLGRWNNMRFSNFEIDMDGAHNDATNVGLKAITINCASHLSFDFLNVHGALATCVATDYPHDVVKAFNDVQTCGRGNPSSGHNGFGDGFRGDDPGESESFISNHCKNCGRVALLAENEVANTTATNASVTFVGNIITQEHNYPLAGAGIDDGTVGGTATGNQIKGPFDTANGETIQYDGIRSTSATIGDAGGAGSVITGNSIQSVRNGITLDENGVGTGIPSYAIVGDNRIARGSGVGMLFNADNTNVFNGLNANDNNISDFGNSCIHFTTAAAHFQNVKIRGGILANCGKTGATALTQAGIATEAPIDGYTVKDVTAKDMGAGTQLYAMANKLANTITGAVIEGNEFSGNVTGMFAPPSAGTINGKVYDNDGSAPPVVTGCTVDTQTGDADAGTMRYTGSSGAISCVLKIYAPLVNAPNGWIGSGSDITGGTTLAQSGESQTTITLKGTANTNDILSFYVRPQ